MSGVLKSVIQVVEIELAYAEVKLLNLDFLSAGLFQVLKHIEAARATLGQLLEEQNDIERAACA